MSSRSNKIEVGNVISVKSKETLFAVKLKARAHLCFQTAFATDHASLFIICKNPDFGFFLPPFAFARAIAFAAASFACADSLPTIKRMIRDHRTVKNSTNLLVFYFPSFVVFLLVF